MKKTFLARRNAILSPKGVPLAALLLGVVLLICLVRFLLPNLFMAIFAPVLSVGNSIDARVTTFIDGFKNAQTLAAQNQTLLDENEALTIQNRTLGDKNSDLSKLFANGSQTPQGILGGVVARPPESPYDTLIVETGTDQGVTIGMEAFGAGGAPVGVVTQTSGSYSRITLFSSAGESISGWVGKDRLALTLLGAGGGAFTSQLPSGSGILAGDTVYVPGPGALPIGTVNVVSSDPSSLIATIQITPLVNPFSITWVNLKDVGTQFEHALATSTPHE